MSQGVAKVKKDKKITWKEIKRQKFLLIVSFFMVIYGIIFYYWPLTGWLMAFQNYKPKDGLLGSKFVGLAKFQFLFQDATFLRVIRNTFCMGVLNLVTSTIMAILFAILLNEIRATKPKKVIQTISYLPHFLSWIIVTGILHDALSSTGIINELLMKAGLIDRAIDFFAHPQYFWWIVAFANCWKETGWNAIIYLAAITSIDPCLYEAASIDGAGRWAKIKYITLPGIKPTIMILLLMNVGNVLNAGFDQVQNLLNPQVYESGDIIDTFIYRIGMLDAQYGPATAMGLFKSIVSCIFISVSYFIAYKFFDYQIF